MTTVKVKRGDHTRDAVFTANADISGATSRRLLAKRGSTEQAELPCELVGTTAVRWLNDGTLATGLYRVELEVTWADAGPITFPTSQDDEIPQYAYIEVIADNG